MAEKNDETPTSPSEDSIPEADQNMVFDDAELALQGITMLLNNEWAESMALFHQHKDYSPLMSAGGSFVQFLQALMTFEDEKLVEAMKGLQETEQRCETSDGFVKSIKKKFSSKKKSEVISIEDRLMQRVLVADSILYQAILTFINQDIPSFVKGGWLLRKAWKIYEKSYKDIRDMYEKVQNGGAAIPNKSSMRKSASQAADLYELTEAGGLPEEVVHRLLGAVSFGYGSFQLCISMVPPKVLKIIEFLGFEGDREVGLKALDLASESKDMKAPLAALAIVWYHTVIRPFFALDGGNVDAGVDEATELVEKFEKQYPKSALFLFFKGRIQRLKSELDLCLSTYNEALVASGDQREMQLICLHEIGWVNMMKLNWAESLKCFSKLTEDSRWSKSYYCYLTAVCQGATGDVKAAASSFKQVPGLIRKKNNQMEAFVGRRSEGFKKVAPSVEHCTLLGLEVLYLWNSIPVVSKSDLKKMLDECGKQRDKKVFHLQSLIEGTIHRQLEDEEMSAQCFEEAIARQNGMKEDQHVAAFAMYELGTMLSQKPQGYVTGKKYLTDVKDTMKDYDFENRLNVRVHAALKRLKSEGTPL